MATVLKDAPYASLETLVRTCIETDALFLLLAGDILDSQQCGLKPYLRLQAAFKELYGAGIQVFIVHGNHDPYPSMPLVKWPENVHVFGPDRPSSLEVFSGSSKVARVFGMSHGTHTEKRNLAALFPLPSDHSVFNVGLLHCNVSGTQGHEPYAPCSLEELRAKGMDYWALGHVHSHNVLSREPYVVYPGIFQGRNPREEGAKGCCVVKVEGTSVSQLEFVPLDQVRWSSVVRDVSGVDDFSTLVSGLEEDIDSVIDPHRGNLIRVALTGKSPLYGELAKAETLEEARLHLQDSLDLPHGWLNIYEVESRVSPAVDITVRSKEEDFLGELLRQGLSLMDGDLESLELRLAGLLQKPDIRRCLGDALGGEELRKILDQAMWLCYSLLEGDMEG